MKKIVLFFILLSAENLFSQCANGLITEGFETSSPANPPSGWEFNGVDTDNFSTFLARTGTKRAGLNAVDESVIVKRLYCPGAINFWWRSSGNSNVFTIDIQYSFDKTTWTTVSSIVKNGASTPSSVNYKEENITFPNVNFVAPFQTYIRFIMKSNTSGTFYLDDLCISKGICTVVPTQLRFFEKPTQCISSNKAFTMKVCATDNNGFIDSTFAGNMSLNLASGTGSLSGTMAIAASGCALFPGVKFSGIAPIEISATAGTLLSNANASGFDIQAKCPNVDTLKLVTYNLLNFPQGGRFALGTLCNPAISDVNKSRCDTLRKIMAYMKPDIMIVQELQSQSGADTVLNRSLNANGITNYALAPFIENQSTANKKYNNALFYNSTKWAVKTVRIIKTSTRDCTYYIMYGKDPNLATHKDTTFIDVLSFHTKARGFMDPVADNLIKANDCKAVIDSIRQWYPGPRNIVLGGDLNLYNKTDDAFQILTTGANKFNDPVPEVPGGDGVWEANPIYAKLHSQAARCQSCLSLECGATGGLDSRLDFWLASDAVMDGSKRVQYIPDSYYVLGNDGSKFNKSINLFTGPNFRLAADGEAINAVPQTILNSLFNMSDHLPLEVKLKITYPDETTALALRDIILKGKITGNNGVLSWDVSKEPSVVSVELFHTASVTNHPFKSIFKTNEVNLLSSFTHAEINEGQNYYKLKIIDRKGDVVYTPIINLKLDGITQAYVAPNPIINELNIKTFHPKNKEITTAKLYSILGKLITQFDIIGSGNCEYKYNCEELAKGIYLLELTNANDKATVKVIKQ